jgi:hypothetical protein
VGTEIFLGDGWWSMSDMNGGLHHSIKILVLGAMKLVRSRSVRLSRM